MQVLTTDVAIIGGGAAGCYAALNLQKQKIKPTYYLVVELRFREMAQLSPSNRTSASYQTVRRWGQSGGLSNVCAFRRRVLRCNDLLCLFVHGHSRIRRRFRILLFRSAHCQWRTRSTEWPDRGTSHATFWHPCARDK